MGYVDQARDGILGWLEGIRYPDEGWGRWPYHAKMQRPYALISSGSAIGLHQSLGALAGVPEAQRKEALAFLQGCQDPADGYYRDPLVREADHIGDHSWEQIYGQMSGAERAVRALGGESPYPVPAARFADLDEEDPAAFTRRIDWSNPWAHGESWSRAIQSFLRARGLIADGANDGRPGRAEKDTTPAVLTAAQAHLAGAFAVYENEVLDRGTGYPSRLMPDPEPSRAMAGLFKCMMAYCAAGLTVPCAKQALDSTLALQHEDGEFGFRNNMCINWDALWVLRELDLQVDAGYRHDEVVAAGVACADHLMRRYRQSDGGFAFHGGEGCMSNHHSIQLSPQRYPISDTLGTIMSLRCLEYVDEWLG